MITPNEEERRSKPAAPLIAKLEYWADPGSISPLDPRSSLWA
jgi:hypothetical protein